MFLTRLAHRLYKLDPNYKKNNIFTWDGAVYHRSDDVRDFVREELRIQVIILPPYGWDSSVCEIFFKILKSVNLNPLLLGTGKKYVSYSFKLNLGPSATP